jgi:Phosphotyrosine-binding domain
VQEVDEGQSSSSSFYCRRGGAPRAARCNVTGAFLPTATVCVVCCKALVCVVRYLVIRDCDFLFVFVACNVIYVNSTDVESLTGPVAISKAIERTFAPGRNPPKTTVVNVKVSSHGITLTDSQRKYVPKL